MTREAQSCNARVILDIGCGKGQLLKMLASKFPESECVGIDLGREIHARRVEAKLNHSRRIHFVRADCRNLPLRSACSQLIFCASVLEHLPDALPATLEMARALESNGTIVAGMPTENPLYRVARVFTGLRKPADHFHEGAYIEGVLEREFARSRLRKLPFSFLPKFLSLYLILVCGKHARGASSEGKHQTIHRLS